MKKIYPFFFIVDDGGFNYALPEKKEGEILLNHYKNILKLAKEFQIRIPICFTMKFLDKENISGFGSPLGYLDDLIYFLKKNNQYLEIGYHGLTHEDEKGGVAEFFSLEKNQPVPEEIQREHIQKSKKIFDFWGIKFPQIFVPPYHAWQEGTTDRILQEFGTKFLVSFKKILFKGYKYSWSGSRYLEFFARFSLGISAQETKIDPAKKRKIKLFPQKTLFDFVKCHIFPQNLFVRLRIHKSILNQPCHSYMTHIGNFSDSSIDFWYQLLDWVKKNKNLYFCHSNEEAVDFFNFLIPSNKNLKGKNLIL